nr:hypothetical protein [Streptomyces sp. TRM72054]
MVVGVAEAERVAGDELDHAVDPFAFGVAVSGVDERGDLGPPAVDGGGELADFGDVGVRAPGEELPAGVADVVAVGSGAGQGEVGAQVRLGDSGRQQRLPDLPLAQERVPHGGELVVDSLYCFTHPQLYAKNASLHFIRSVEHRLISPPLTGLRAVP